MDLLIFLGLGVLALALIFAVFFKKIVIDRQIEKLNDLEDEVEKAKLKANLARSPSNLRRRPRQIYRSNLPCRF